MNISTGVVLAAVCFIVGIPVYQAIRTGMKAQDIDAMIRKKLEDATYFIEPHVFDLLNKQYSPEQLQRVQPWIDKAQAEIAKKRAVQETNEKAMMAKYQAYIEADNPFEKCRLGRELPKQWHEAAGRTRDQLKHSRPFRDMFEALLKDVHTKNSELATQLYNTYLARARAGDPISFGKLELQLQDFAEILKYPSDWSELAGTFMVCPDLYAYGYFESHRHEDPIKHPSAPQLRLMAIKAIDEDDAVAAKLCLAFADSPNHGRVPLEEELCVKLGQIVYAFNQGRLRSQP